MKFFSIDAVMTAARTVMLTVVITGALTACAPLVTQNPGGSISPANVVTLDGNERVMLKGADVVAYFTKNDYVQGTPTIKTDYQKITFYFSSIEHKALFDKEPTKYLPMYGGFCANGISYGIPWGGDADTWRIFDGKLHIFGGAQSRDAFLLDVPKNRQLAEQYWKDEVTGSNAFVQRTKRLMFKVPHYKTDADVAAEIAKTKK